MIRVRDWAEMKAMLAINAPLGVVLLSETEACFPFDCRMWMADTRNVALRRGADLAMFEYMGPGVYEGHIFFASRGQTAADNAAAALDYMFANGAQRIIGEIPASRRDLMLFMRRIGFKVAGKAMRPHNGKVEPVTVVELANRNTQPLPAVA